MWLLFKIRWNRVMRKTFTAQKMKFSIEDFFSKCDKNFIFCAVFFFYHLDQYVLTHDQLLT